MELNYKDGRLIPIGIHKKLLYFDNLKDLPFEIFIKGQRSTKMFWFTKRLTGHNQKVYNIYMNYEFLDLEIRFEMYDK